MKKRYRFIASNLHVGGGVQVGASLVDEIARLADQEPWIEHVASTEFEISPSVARNADPKAVDRLGCEIVLRRPGSLRPRLRDLRACAASLVVFGPTYSLPRSRRRVMGFADVTSIYAPVMGGAPLQSRIRGWLSRAEASAQDLLLVETPAMADRLSVTLRCRTPEILVVSNTVNARVLEAPVDRQLADRIMAGRGETALLLAYPTRPYPHKNLPFLPLVARALEARGITARFLLTLTEDEWDCLNDDVREVSMNMGEIDVGQIPTLMRSSDAVFFPSLLEAYSATPVESLALGVPLYASDRDFVRSICGDAAVYFDPTIAEFAAEAIAQALTEPREIHARTEEGKIIARSLPTPFDRARAMLSALYDLPRNPKLETRHD